MRWYSRAGREARVFCCFVLRSVENRVPKEEPSIVWSRVVIADVSFSDLWGVTGAAHSGIYGKGRHYTCVSAVGASTDPALLVPMFVSDPNARHTLISNQCD